MLEKYFLILRFRVISKLHELGQKGVKSRWRKEGLDLGRGKQEIVVRILRKKSAVHTALLERKTIF
ncbi:hypothetical protein D3C87_1858760 [compost metagenome]